MTRKSLIGLIVVALLGLPALLSAQEQVPSDAGTFTFYSGVHSWSGQATDLCSQCESESCSGCAQGTCATTCNDFTQSSFGTNIASEEQLALFSGQQPFVPVEPLTHHLSDNFTPAPMMEQSPELTAYRDNIARHLTEYLMNGQHDAEHVQTVIGLALDAAADSARQSGIDQMPPAIVQVTPQQQTATDIQHEWFQSHQRQMTWLQQQQAEQQELLVRLQRDIQTLTQSLSDLNVRTGRYDQFHPRNNQYREGRIYWASQPESLQSTPTGGESPEQLRARIRDLENQLQFRMQNAPVRQALMEAPLSTSNHSHGTLQPASYVPTPLQPQRDYGSPLRPSQAAAPEMVTVSYYVGDLMGPPFASATLKLVQYLKGMVAPNSWDEASIQVAEPAISLVITQTPHNQNQIRYLLRQIRAGARTYQR